MFAVLHPTVFWTAVTITITAIQLAGALTASAFFRHADASRKVTMTA